MQIKRFLSHPARTQFSLSFCAQAAAVVAAAAIRAAILIASHFIGFMRQRVQRVANPKWFDLYTLDAAQHRRRHLSLFGSVSEVKSEIVALTVVTHKNAYEINCQSKDNCLGR